MDASQYLLLAIDLCNQNLDKEDIIIELQDAMYQHGDCSVTLQSGRKNYYYNAKKLYRCAKKFVF